MYILIRLMIAYFTALKILAAITIELGPYEPGVCPNFPGDEANEPNFLTIYFNLFHT